MHYPRTLAASLCIVAVLGCNGDNVVRTRVGSVEFCVPKKNAIEVSGWLEYATRHLPDSGFAFIVEPAHLPKSIGYVPSLSIRGDPRPVTGVVEVESLGMIDLFPPDHHWVQYANAPGALIERSEDAHTLTAFEDSTREFWVVWQFKAGEELSPESLSRAARVLAYCRKTVFGSSPSNKVQTSVHCRRTITDDGLRISYSFGESNLRILPAMDAAVIHQVKARRCQRASAA